MSSETKAPQPPAEAQGDGEASEGWHAALDSASELVSNAPDARYRKRAEQVRDWIKAHPAAPPSAPVGVKIPPRKNERDSDGKFRTIYLFDTPHEQGQFQRHVEFLAQQPSVAPVGVEAKDAEIEALRAEREVIGAEAVKYADKSGRLEAKVERLAEALREIESVAQGYVKDVASDYLRDHDQEARNG